MTVYQRKEFYTKTGQKQTKYQRKRFHIKLARNRLYPNENDSY